MIVAGCVERPPPSGMLVLRPLSFRELPGWEQDRQSEAVPALERSCQAITKKPDEAFLGLNGTAGKAAEWKPICAELAGMGPDKTDATARRFFERNFIPYTVLNEKTGLFTGYYEAEIRGSRERQGAFQFPLWQKPRDLVTVDLGEFSPSMKNRRIYGKVIEGKLRPYDDRTAITAGSLAGRAEPLLWTDDPISAFFLEIQGSGLAFMQDGRTERVQYEAQNGRPYIPIGRILAERGEIEKPVTMKKIRNWLKANSGKAQDIMNLNPSVVFFRFSKGEGPVGAQGVVLTPGRSLAVDPDFIPFGAPLWLDIKANDANDAIPPRLVVAQDAGGAIKGPVRGDLFWGAGSEAEERAGNMQSKGAYYLLLPKTVNPDESK